MKPLKSILFGLAIASVSFAAFDPCKFNFGRQWSNSFNSGTSFAGQGLSHLAIWLGDNASYNTYWEGAMAQAAKSNNLTPVIYAYVIAEVGKESNWSDCDSDTDGSNLCTKGADLIRNSWNEILNRYGSYAQGLAGDYGTSGTIIWLIEPDFVQYSVTGDAANTKYTQAGGAIADAELAGTKFNQIVAKIKQYLPNAKIAVDISPWLNNTTTTWYNNFDKSKVDYLFTSGGRTKGDQTRIRTDNGNNLTWAQASAAMGGKRIIADDGYGVGGSSNTDYADWMNATNINSRIADGVIGITIQEPNSAFTTFAAQNGNLTTNCGTPLSSAVLLSSTPPVSSSNKPISSSNKPISSSNPAISSSIKPSSSSNAITPSSAYIPVSSSNTTQPSSSSATVISDGSWSGTNAQITSATNSGASIGVGSSWTEGRVISKVLGTVVAGTTYTLSFKTDLSRGGQSMEVPLAVGTYCNKTLTISSAEVSEQSCQFTATSAGSVTMTLTLPASRWETLTISELKLVDGTGQQAGTKFMGPMLKMRSAAIQLRSGAQVHWLVPEGSRFEVFSVTGNRVMQTSSSAPNFSNLPLGLYFVRVRAENMVDTRRIKNF